jgi:hypothetical protein
MMARKIVYALVMVVVLLGTASVGVCGDDEGRVFTGNARWGKVEITITDDVAKVATVRRVTTSYDPPKFASDGGYLTAYGLRIRYGDHEKKLKAKFFVVHADGKVEELWGNSVNRATNAEEDCYRQRDKNGVGCQEFSASTFAPWNVAVVTLDDGAPNELKIGERRTIVQGKKGK